MRSHTQQRSCPGPYPSRGPRPQPVGKEAPPPQYPQVTIQSSGPIRVIVGAGAQLGLHVPPGSTVALVPIALARSAPGEPAPVSAPAPVLRTRDRDIRARADFGAPGEEAGAGGEGARAPCARRGAGTRSCGYGRGDKDTNAKPRGGAGGASTQSSNGSRRNPNTGNVASRGQKSAPGATGNAATVSRLDAELDEYMAGDVRNARAPLASEKDYASMLAGL